MKLLFLSIKNRVLDFCEKYKKEILGAILVFLIASISFALGFLVASEIVTEAPIIIEKCSE